MDVVQTVLEKYRRYKEENPVKAFFFGMAIIYGIYRLIGHLTKKPKSLQNKVIVITGGASGIGKSVAMKAKRRGATVIIWDINEQMLNEMKQIVNATAKVDVTSRQNVMEAANEVLNKFRKIDILVNNAGIVSGKSFLDLSENSIRKTFDVNIVAHFWTIQAFLPTMLKQKSAQIVTIASTAGRTGVAGLTDYCASKFAARGLDEALRHELQRDNYNHITLTCVNPYFINTGMFDGTSTSRGIVKLLKIAPLLEQEYVSSEIINAIIYDKREVILPYRLGIMYTLEPFLPYWLQDYLVGLSCDMSTFKGRHGT